MFAHAEAEDPNKAKWIILGIPIDLGSLSKVKNYQEGPEAIRDASYRVFYPLFGDLNPKEIYDWGDLEINNPFDINSVYKEIEEKIDKILKLRKKLLIFGGDHSITYPILKSLKKYHKDFYLLYFDAHPDMQPDEIPNYQSFLYHLIKNNILDPEKVILVGISNWSEEEREFIIKKKIKYFLSYDLWENSDNVINEISNILDKKNVYISIDLDVFDAGAGHWVEPFGINLYHFYKIIRSLDINLLGCDIVELFPSERAENLAAKLSLEILSTF